MLTNNKKKKGYSTNRHYCFLFTSRKVLNQNELKICDWKQCIHISDISERASMYPWRGRHRASGVRELDTGLRDMVKGEEV